MNHFNLYITSINVLLNKRIKCVYYFYQQEGILSVEEAMEQAKNLGIMTASEPTNDDGNGDEKIFNFGVYKYGRDRTSLSRRILQV